MKTHNVLAALSLLLLINLSAYSKGQNKPAQVDSAQTDIRRLVVLVNDAIEKIRFDEVGAFKEFRTAGSKWRHGETYLFVLDPEGTMLVHSDPVLEGKNQLELKDINGRPIVQGLLHAAASDSAGGWYHYQWPVPGGLLPRWKSSFVKTVVTPSGKKYIVGCGTYNDRMERPFVINMVNSAVTLVGQQGSAAFPLLRDSKGPFMAKDAYIFVVDDNGVELVNPGFPSLEGRNVLDVKDTQGKYLVREMFAVTGKQGSGWVEYMWPKPGESASTLKSTYVRQAMMDGKPVIVGCGVYLPGATVRKSPVKKMKANELVNLVHEASVVFSEKGEKAYSEFRTPGSKWFHDETYFFVWDMTGKRVFHAANPAGEGQMMRDSKDVLGRPWGKMFLETAASPTGEGWVHYLYPEPGDIFPAWKSSYIERVRFPDGKQYLVGCGIYQMEMNQMFIEDVVNHAAQLVEEKGPSGFDTFRDKTGTFLFLDTYVFVDTPDGVELVNAAQPSLEHKNLIDLKDANGDYVMKEYLEAAMKKGSSWVDYHWYKPGTNTPAKKHTFVRKAVYQGTPYVVGAGYYD